MTARARSLWLLTLTVLLALAMAAASVTPSRNAPTLDDYLEGQVGAASPQDADALAENVVGGGLATADAHNSPRQKNNSTYYSVRMWVHDHWSGTYYEKWLGPNGAMSYAYVESIHLPYGWCVWAKYDVQPTFRKWWGSGTEPWRTLLGDPVTFTGLGPC